MKYLVSLYDAKTGDHCYVYTFAPLEDGSTIQWGHDDGAPDGLRSWLVRACSPCPNGI